MDKPEDLSDCEPETRVDASVVLDVTAVPVSPSSVVSELCDGFSCGSDLDFMEPQSFSFFKKRLHSWTVAQKEMWSEEPQVKAPSISRRRMMPPTPLQNSYASLVGEFRSGRPVERERQSGHCKDEAAPGKR